MKQPCIHCGSDCGNNPVIWNDKPFCCHGCKAVYQILHEKDLQHYYQIQPMAGIRLENPPQLDKFAFLDNPEIAEKLLDFHDGEISRVTFFIPVIHCASCIWLLEHLHQLHPGITFSSVNFPRKEVHITFKHQQITLRQVAELLASLHYVPEITLDRLSKKSGSRTNRRLLVKIGIASFSFMNIMLFTFPDYVPGGEFIEKEFRNLFSILSFILILPVVFYSASDYYLSAWKGLKKRIISIDLPITLGILALFLQSSWEIFHGHGLGYMDSLAGLIFFLLIGKWYQGKTYESLSFERDYRSYFPVAVTRINSGGQEIIPISKLRPGDRILIRNQELIPADSLIESGTGSIDYSFVTGESIPVVKHPGDLVFAGGRQTGSSIVLKVEKEVEQSYLTQLWNQQEKYPEKQLLRSQINLVSQYFTVVVLLIAFTAFLYWAGRDFSRAIFVFSSVLIVACPCALALTIPFTFGSTLRVFGKRGFYLRTADVIETLHRTTDVVFDKTGTLTLSRQMAVNYTGQPLSAEELSLVRSVVQHSSHPLSVTLYDHLAPYPVLPVTTYSEVPGMGITAEVNGKRINLGSHYFVQGSHLEETASETRVYLSINRQLKGYFTVTNIYRPGLEAIVQNLKGRYRLHLITGDNEAEKSRLREIFGEDATLLFHQTPTMKRDYIRKLRSEGRRVLMIGDGLNDAGALMESDTGIAIADDVYSFSPACDAILSASRFPLLHRFLKFTGSSFGVVRVSFALSFLYNLIGLSFAVTARLSPLVAAILMPISSVTVVALATFSITFLAWRKLGRM